jgi:hypothetical protein
LVLSRKNKKKQKAKLRMESPRKVESVRRSRRTAPSVYRSKGGQENHVTSKRKKNNLYCDHVERPILEL